jgi:hypothetical protein
MRRRLEIAEHLRQSAAHQRLLELGVDFLNAPRVITPMPAYDLWMAAFRDSEGNIMELMSEVPR